EEAEDIDSNYKKYIGHFKDFTDPGPEYDAANSNLKKMEVVVNVLEESIEEDWNPKHFTFDGTTLTGFSQLGQKKFQEYKDLVIPEKTIDGQIVDSIGDKAFNVDDFGAKDGIQSLKLPDTIKTIGEMAFRNKNIVKRELPDSIEELGNGVFAANQELKTLKLSNNLKVIPDGAFSFAKIEELVIPEGVTEIGGSTFSENNLLSSLSIPSTLEKIGSRAFWNIAATSLTIPGNVKELDKDAFTGGNLSSLTLEEGIETIRARAFKRNNLREVIIPKSVTYLHKSAFDKNPDIDIKYAGDDGEEPEGKWKLEDFEYDNTKITGFSETGEKKFKNNKDLVIPEKTIDGQIVDSIGDKAFNVDDFGAKDGIQSLKLPDTIKTIGEMAFRNNNIVNLELPDSIEELGNGVLAANQELKTLKLSNNLKVIPDGALSFAKIEELVIPEGVTEIGGSTFSENNLLSSLSIPSTLEKIGSRAFWNIAATSLTIPGNVKELDKDAFT